MMRMEERERERDGDKMREKVVVTMGEVIMKKDMTKDITYIPPLPK